MTKFNTGFNDDQFVDRRNNLTESGYTILGAATRSDGYVFYVVREAKNTKPVVYAGCRRGVTFAWFRAHTKQYWGHRGRSKRKETLMILDLLAYTAKRIT